MPARRRVEASASAASITPTLRVLRTETWTGFDSRRSLRSCCWVPLARRIRVAAFRRRLPRTPTSHKLRTTQTLRRRARSCASFIRRRVTPIAWRCTAAAARLLISCARAPRSCSSADKRSDIRVAANGCSACVLELVNRARDALNPRDRAIERLSDRAAGVNRRSARRTGRACPRV
jgi:hypothetical protein